MDLKYILKFTLYQESFCKSKFEDHNLSSKTKIYIYKNLKHEYW